MKAFTIAAVLTALTSLPAAQASECTGSVRASLRGLRGTGGAICYNVFASAEGFPTDPSRAVAAACVPVDGRSEIQVDGLCDGTYALSVVHDVNGNGRLDTGAFGIPTEPFGFSNNPQIRVGPPTFAECAFELRSEAALGIEMRSL